MLKRSDLAGKAQTVFGLIDPESLGITLPHEHLLMDLTKGCFIEPDTASERALAHQPVRMENLYWLHTHWINNVDNMQFLDLELAIKEAHLFKRAGGDTIVEVSNIGLSRDPQGLVSISRATGLNIIMGAGYYVGSSYPPDIAEKSEKEIAQSIVREITVGVDNTGIRAGIIGEIGCSKPLEADEKKVLRACAIAQQQTGAPLSIHPSPDDELVHEIVKILQEAEADMTHTVICHCDIFGLAPDTLDTIADAGCFLEYDNFGQPAGVIFVFQDRLIETPSDVQRINAIIGLIDKGYLDQILISSDHCYKQLFVTYGGYGYAHVVREVAPWMKLKGMSDEQIHTIMVENPKRFLTFTAI
ncbi:MAG: TatD family hydrolase [Spirochaetota bacterium]|nr:MAG: TatD family hydrolase [Spirochaetota bacterium]